MNLAVLIICHKNPDQINALIDTLVHDCVHVFLHIDKKSTIDDAIFHQDNLTVIPEDKRIDVRWGDFSQVQAIETLINAAIDYGKFDYFWLISGQDVLIKPINEIIDYLSKHMMEGMNFIDFVPSKNTTGFSNNFDKRNEIFYPSFMLGKKILNRFFKKVWVNISGGYNYTFKIFRRNSDIKFYFGSEWWCLSNKTIIWIMENIQSHYKYFINCNCPDESVFQTMFMLSPYSDFKMEHFLFVKWEDGFNSPKNLTIDDYTDIMNSNKLIARKIDDDWLIINKLVGNK